MMDFFYRLLTVDSRNCDFDLIDFQIKKLNDKFSTYDIYPDILFGSSLDKAFSLADILYHDDDLKVMFLKQYQKK